MSRRFAGRAASAIALPALIGLLAFAARGVGEPSAAPAAKPAQPAPPKSAPAADKTVSAAAETPVEKALSSIVSLHFSKTPLKEFAAKIAREQKINVLLDHGDLVFAQINESTPLTIDLEGVPLGVALDLLLEQQQLGYATPQDNVLLIVPRGAANSHAVTKTFGASLLRPQMHEFVLRGADWSLAADVPHLATSRSWENTTGLGAIACFDGKLIVSQTDDGQRQVAALLRALDTARREQATRPGGDPIRIDAGSGQREDNANTILRRRMDIHFDKMPLDELARWLGRLGVPAFVDHKSIVDSRPPRPASADRKEPTVSLTATNVELRWALQQMLGDDDLACQFDRGVLVISAFFRDEFRCCVVYPVGDLIASEMATAGVDVNDAYDDLSRAIITTVSPPSWTGFFLCGTSRHVNDGRISLGEGTLVAAPSAQAVICNQTPEVQEEVARLLTRLRAERRTVPQPATQAPGGEEMPVIRIYACEGVSLNEDGAELVEKYAAAVKSMIEPQIWTSGKADLSIFSNRIVARCPIAVQRRIRALLREMGAIAEGEAPPTNLNRGPYTPPAPQPFGGPGGRGGGAF